MTKTSMHRVKRTDDKWKDAMFAALFYGQESSPRGMKIKEKLAYQYKINMNEPIIRTKARDMNYKFMFGEALWICSGSNKLADITKYLKNYNKYSDDGVFLNSAYGPKFVDQLPYIISLFKSDLDTRQAVINIWREKPGISKDIACTLSHQYFVRNGELHTVATMRSQDLVWGFCYDIFTFTMMSKVVQSLLAEIGHKVNLGELTVTVGSAHIYENFWDSATTWIKNYDLNETIKTEYDKEFSDIMTYSLLLDKLQEFAEKY